MQNPVRPLFEKFGVGVEDVISSDDTYEVDGVRKVAKLWKYAFSLMGGLAASSVIQAQSIVIESSNQVLESYATVGLGVVTYGIPLAGATFCVASALEFRRIEHESEARLIELNGSAAGEDNSY